MKAKFSTSRMLLLTLLFVFMQKTEAQTGSVGIGITTPDPSSILDISSNNRGVLLPRLTVGERDAIASPATGLLIYQWDVAPGFYYYSGGWQSLTSSSGASANQTLSNLQAATAINTDLNPGSSASYSLGSSSLSWKDIYFFGDVYLQGSRFISSRSTNQFFGLGAGNSAVTGEYNTATGYNALTTNITGFWNTAIGFESLYNTNNGFGNTGVGFQSLIGNTSGTYNTALGALALVTNSTGLHNTAVGNSAASNLPSGSQNTFLGAETNVPLGTSLSNSTAIGYGATITSSNSIRVGNTAVTSIGGNVGWTAFSDGRFKKNITENVPGLAFINQLRPVTYNLDVDGIDKTLQPTVSEAQKNLNDVTGRKGPGPEELRSKQEKSAIIYTGFIAQEVEAASNKLGYRFSGVDAPKNSGDFYGLRYAEFVVPLVKAVQELNLETERLKKERNFEKNTTGKMEGTIKEQQAQLDRQQKELTAFKVLLTQMQKQINDLKASGK